MWVPISVTTLFSFSIELINFIMIGHLNEPKLLAAIALGNISINFLALSFVEGMNTALETFVA